MSDNLKTVLGRGVIRVLMQHLRPFRESFSVLPECTPRLMRSARMRRISRVMRKLSDKRDSTANKYGGLFSVWLTIAGSSKIIVIAGNIVNLPRIEADLPQKI